ncbi:NlpC/P60 family protein [Aliarcobacter vitoriensis]|uniref:NlpC/P60 family protein n=1 Tax=Aliarcobacter vitoriensis TaxID=2011099 RepID=UPI003AB0C6FF
MNIRKSFLSIVIFSSVFTGCATTSSQKTVDASNFQNNTYNSNQEQQTHLKKHTFLEDVTYSNYMSKDKKINDKLFSFYDEWKGTKYRIGGYSKKGIDCSGFVQKALAEKFNLQLPRDTRSQVQVGKTVKKSDLQMGDLVFFHTGKTKHVGIYIEDGKFMHSSTKIGVTISELDNVYFKNRYWTAKRVLK